MILKSIVNRVAIAAIGDASYVRAGSPAAAASRKPRPVVVSTNPVDGAVDVDVETSITVNFSLPMSCGSINKHTFRLKPVGWSNIAASSITCSGSIAIFTPSRALAVNTRYRITVRRNGQGCQRHDAEGWLSLGFYHCSELQTPGHRDANRNCHHPQRPRQIRRQLHRRQRRLPPTPRPRRRPQLRLPQPRRPRQIRLRSQRLQRQLPLRLRRPAQLRPIRLRRPQRQLTLRQQRLQAQRLQPQPPRPPRLRLLARRRPRPIRLRSQRRQRRPPPTLRLPRPPQLRRPPIRQPRRIRLRSTATPTATDHSDCDGHCNSDRYVYADRNVN